MQNVNKFCCVAIFLSLSRKTVQAKINIYLASLSLIHVFPLFTLAMQNTNSLKMLFFFFIGSVWTACDYSFKLSVVCPWASQSKASEAHRMLIEFAMIQVQWIMIKSTWKRVRAIDWSIDRSIVQSFRDQSPSFSRIWLEIALIKLVYNLRCETVRIGDSERTCHLASKIAIDSIGI